jgi:aspartate oxidase
VLTKAELVQSATRWAQGGVAAVLSDDPDSADLHLADTLKAGAGLCDVDAVRVMVDEGPGRVNELIALGAMFDRDPDGALQLAREGGHSYARVVHAGGAATGAEIERALVEAVRLTAAAVMEHWFALDFIVEDGRCRGVVAVDPSGARQEVRAAHTLLASGGAGQLFSVTTNPEQSTGDGLAMAVRAGVPVADEVDEVEHLGGQRILGGEVASSGELTEVEPAGVLHDDHHTLASWPSPAPWNVSLPARW